MEPYTQNIRPASVAGLFYPADKLMLERELSLMLENAPVLEPPRPIRGLIVPHGGFLYSGGVAARAYRQIIDQPCEGIVLIAPPHESTLYFTAVYSGKAFRTPLGDVQVNQQLASKLVDLEPTCKLSEQGFEEGEYTIEVQLPFVQWVQDGVPILPIMMGRQDREAVEKLTQALLQLAKNRQLLFIASTDLSQNHPDTLARRMDQVCISHIERFDPDGLLQDVEQGACEMCGSGPAVVVMKLCQALGATQARVLLYRNSADITGERDKVVGYLSAIFY
ncbi:MAG: AmmeMemoRadiSam system protein B [Calditrichaeota bacterium]|nr:MAG: AmmeMemoRadiSam system protein B [Calditrichota bacterium]